MAKILKNPGVSDITIDDVGGVVIPASGQKTIDPLHYRNYARSSDTVTFVGNSDLIVNDGSEDLGISDGIDLIKGIFQKTRIIGDTDDTLIGNINDALKVHHINNPGGEIPTFSFPEVYHDYFGRLRVSNPTTLGEYSHRISKDDDHWDESTSNGGSSTYQSDRISVKIESGTSNGGKVIRQTYRNFQYFKGKAQLIYSTFNLHGEDANCRKRIGYFEENDGYFLENDGTTTYFVIRSKISGSVVETKIAQDDWSHDTLDGSSDADNPSGLTLDLSKVQLLYINFGWLAVAGVQFGFLINESFVLCHHFKFSNIITSAYSRSGVLPLRMEIENTAAQGTSPEMEIICNTVISEGGDVEQGVVRPIDSGDNHIYVNTSEKVLGGIRIKSTVDKPVSVRPMSIQIMPATDTKVARYRTYLRPSIGGNWSSVPGSEIVEYLTNHPSFSGGILVDSGYVKGEAESIGLDALLESDIYLGRAIDGTWDEFIVTLEVIDGSGDFSFAMNFREFI